MTLPAVLVVGRSGQLALALSRLSGDGVAYHCVGRPQLDMAAPDSIAGVLADIRPQAVINAAAYTAVDKAEREPDLAFQVNAGGPAVLAAACQRRAIPLLHVSTDYVFDGTLDRPYRPDDPVMPLGVYGKSKAAGEQAIRDAADRHLIVRTSWLYSRDGHNFLKTMLRLGREKATLSVVDDQAGSPTYAADLADGLHRLVILALGDAELAGWGTFHLCSSGSTTWFGFADEIFRQAAQYSYPPPSLQPIPTSAFPTDAARPANSVLDCSRLKDLTGIELPHWRQGVRECVKSLLFNQAEAAERT